MSSVSRARMFVAAPRMCTCARARLFAEVSALAVARAHVGMSSAGMLGALRTARAGKRGAVVFSIHKKRSDVNPIHKRR